MSIQDRCVRRLPFVGPIASLALAWIALTAGARASDTQVMLDGTFAPWMVSQKIVDTTPGAGATFTSTTQSFGGPSGDWRETSHTYADGTILVAHVDSQHYYSNNNVAICKVDFAADLIHHTGATVGGAVSYRLCVEQSGSYYGGPSINVFDPLWASYVQPGLTPADFTLFAGSGPLRPDFSCTRPWTVFGFITGNSATGGPVTKVSGIDNWMVTLHLDRVAWFDDAFPPANWTSAKLIDTTPGAAATTTSITQPTGGANGPYRETTHTWSDGTIVVGHLNALMVHDPVPEPVYSVTVRLFANHLTWSTIGGAVGLQFAVRQGGNWFGGPTINVFVPSWVTYGQDLVSEDFTNLLGSGPLRPDFSTTGGLLEFGYLTSNSANGGPVTKVLGVDEVFVRANLAPLCTGTLGASGCYGDDPGSPCPCFPGVPAGGPGRGCPNSVEALGAMLVGFGTASIANDTVVLQAQGMPNSSCLYFQGAGFNNVLFGDGKRCTAGATIRLGTTSNLCNSSQYPAGSEAPISVQGNITAPGIRTYQVWYRNAANFCTSSTFNLTNSLSINWTL